MKKIKLLFLLLFVLIINLNHSEAQVADETERTPTNRVIVSYKTESAMNADRIKLKKYNPIKVSDASKTLLITYPNVTFAQIELEKFKIRSDVSYAFNDEILYATVVPYVTPNDPSIGFQYYLTKCKFDLAWDLVKGNGSVLVGVVDTGFETFGHVDITNVRLPGYNGLDGTSNTQPDVFNGPGRPHGINVSGLITATTNNSIGMSSGSWNAKLLPMKAALGGGTLKLSSNAVLKCFEYADRNDVKVLNASMSGTEGDGPLATKVIPYYDKGLIFVGAAGNNNTININTSKYVIRVGALTPDDNKASFSNYGIGVDIFAPGVNIYTTTLGNKYDPKVGGTSFATPIVSSLVVLLKTINPAYKTLDIKRILKRTATDLNTPGWDLSTGWGRINAYDAVRYALGMYNPVDQFPPTVLLPPLNDGRVYKLPNPTIIRSGTTQIFIAADDNFELQKVEFFIDDIKLNTFTNFDFSNIITDLITRNFSNGLHTLKAIATDTNGYSSESTTTINIQNTIDNTPPTIAFVEPSANSILNGSITLKVSALDDDSVTNVDFYIDGIFLGSVPKSFFQQSTYSLTIDTNKYSTGNKVLKAIAKDPSNNTSEASITVKFTDENDTTPPSIMITSPQTLTIVRENIQITYIARDDRGIVKFNLYRNNVLVKSTLNAFAVTDSLTTLKNGDYTYYVEAIDLNGNIGRSLPIVLRKR